MGDSYLALIIPFIVKCFDVYLFRQFFLDVPDDLIEAAEIDGAGPFKTFLQVIIPVSKPVFATVFILDYVAYWSDFMWPLLVITDAGKRTVQLGIQTFFTEPPVYYGPYHMAALTIASVPMIIMFLFLQKYYIAGISTSIKKVTSGDNIKKSKNIKKGLLMIFYQKQTFCIKNYK